MSRPRVPIGQSAPAQPAGAVAHGRPAGADVRSVTVVLRPGEPTEDLARTLHERETLLPLSRPASPSRQVLAEAHAPAAEHFAAVERFAREHGLEVVARSVAQHRVQLRGPVSSLEAAFGVQLEQFQHGDRTYESHQGPVQVPDELKDIVEAVIGLDATPLSRPLVAIARPRVARARSYTPVQPATVLSFSWGWTEAQSTGNGKRQIDIALQKARQLGITVCCASGDLGSLGVEPSGNTGYEGAANVSFPASSPSALGCGGTTIRRGEETAWNNPVWKATPMASGGGVSGFFPRPLWQAGHRVPMHRKVGKAWLEEGLNAATWTGRGVPDVAATADALSGYELYVGGQRALGGGTSAATPLWAGLIALLNQRLSEIGGRPITLGFMNALLYRRDVASALREARKGDNRLPASAAGVAYFTAGPGWNACTGLGVPDGADLLAALSRPEPPRRARA